MKTKNIKKAVLMAAFFVLTLSQALALASAEKLFKNPFSQKNKATKIETVFLYKSAIWTADNETPKKLFDVSNTVKSRSVSSTNNSILSWDALSKNLTSYNAKGKKNSTKKIPASYVWLKYPYALSMSEHYEANNGFLFSLYKISNEASVKTDLIWECYIDCFVSDLAFANDGTLFIAGGDGEDSKHNVFKIDKNSGKLENILSLDWQGFFLRLILTEDNLLCFGSGREKAKDKLEIYIADAKGHDFTSFELAVNLDDALCWFGFGFAFSNDNSNSNSRFQIPLSLDSGEIGIISFNIENNKPKNIKQIENSGGVFLPIGIVEKQNSFEFKYLAHDPIANPSLYEIASFDGKSIKKIKLK